jgi:nuclear pore complex protein Nup188
MLEKQSGQKSNKPVPLEKLTMTPLSRRLSQQSSSEDGDSHSAEVMETQHRLLLILSQCLAAMRQFSPDLCEILLDQSMDVGEYVPILAIGFSTPSLEQDTPPSFGTLVSSTNLCVQLLAKLDPRPTSPVKSPDPDSIPVKRPVVMFVLENTLQLLMSQAMRYLREPGLPARDKQLLKRELRSELNTFLLSMQRHLSRRGAPPSPAAGTSQQISPQGLSKSLSQSSFASSQEQAFFKLIDNFVKNILR